MQYLKSIKGAFTHGILEVVRRRRVLMRWPIRVGCERRRGRGEDEERGESEVLAVENRDLDACRQAISPCKCVNVNQGFVLADLSPTFVFCKMFLGLLLVCKSRPSLNISPYI